MHIKIRNKSLPWILSLLLLSLGGTICTALVNSVPTAVTYPALGFNVFGIQSGLKTDKAQYTNGEPIFVQISVRNTSDIEIRYPHLKLARLNYKFDVIKHPNQLVPRIAFQPSDEELLLDSSASSSILKAGQTFVQEFEISKLFRFYEAGVYYIVATRRGMRTVEGRLSDSTSGAAMITVIGPSPLGQAMDTQSDRPDAHVKPEKSSLPSASANSTPNSPRLAKAFQGGKDGAAEARHIEITSPRHSGQAEGLPFESSSVQRLPSAHKTEAGIGGVHRITYGSLIVGCLSIIAYLIWRAAHRS